MRCSILWLFSAVYNQNGQQFEKAGKKQEENTFFWTQLNIYQILFESKVYINATAEATNHMNL